MVYVIQVCSLLASRISSVLILLASCQQPVWHKTLLCVQWKTPDDGERNCPKHVAFYSKFCSQAVSTYTTAMWTVKNSWRWTEELSETCSFIPNSVRKLSAHTPLLCEQWKTPDDGQRNCPKHVEFYSKFCSQVVSTYTTAMWTVKNSWRWTEELSETCSVSFQK